MALLSPKLFLAFDAGFVTGVTLSAGLRSRRVTAAARARLEAGAILPSVSGANIARPDEVHEALRSVAETLNGFPAAAAALILPEGAARTLLVEVPPGTDPAEFARFRLGQGLPYPADEAVVDVLLLGHGRYLAAALRRSVAQGYERAASRAGFAQERVDLAPLAALAGLLRQLPATPGVDVLLGDAGVSFAGYREGELRAFRSRRRDPGPGEAERLRDEADRTALLAGAAANGSGPRLRVVGPGAPDLLRAFALAGCPAEPAWSAAPEGLAAAPWELAWLGDAL